MFYRCSRCERETLPASAFSPSQLTRSGRWCKDCHNEHRRLKWAGLLPPRKHGGVCTTCGADITHKRPHARYCSRSCANKGWRIDNPGRQRWAQLKCQYGITEDDFELLFNSQGRCCAICGTDTPPPNGKKTGGQWNVDHCHESKKVRGILCSSCNTGIGLFRDDPATLERAIAYLKRAGR